MENHSGTFTKVGISLRPLISFAWRVLLTLTVCRAIFIAWQWERLVDADMLSTVLIQGVRFDLVLLGLMLTIAALCYPMLASSRLLMPAWRGLLKGVLPIVLLFIVFIECSTPSFVDQFDSRPNILFFEYLNHPGEVGATLWAAYKFPILLTVLFATTFTWINARQLGRLVSRIQPIGVMPAILVTPLLLIVCFGLIRSTLDNRPVNPGTVALSNDPLVNDLALNSAETVLYAVHESRHEPEGGIRYGKIDDSDVLDRVRSDMMMKPEKPRDDGS